MATAKEIKGRLNSIKNTKKTTHAMELVSAAKMRKAVEATVAARQYAQIAQHIMDELRRRTKIDAKNTAYRFFSEQKETGKTTLIAFASNRGLCGAFNAHIIRLVLDEVTKRGKENIEIIGIGKRVVSMLTAFGVPVSQAYEKDEKALSDDSIRDVMSFVYKQYAEGKTDRVLIAHTDYISAISQKAQITQLFPFSTAEAKKEESEYDAENGIEPVDVTYEYEPHPERVLEYIIPRMAEIALYQALLESNASEHSARMLAMKSATDAASDMARELNLVFNRARQAAITKEIAEIAAGTAAVT